MGKTQTKIKTKFPHPLSPCQLLRPAWHQAEGTSDTARVQGTGHLGGQAKGKEGKHAAESTLKHRQKLG